MHIAHAPFGGCETLPVRDSRSLFIGIMEALEPAPAETEKVAMYFNISSPALYRGLYSLTVSS